MEPRTRPPAAKLPCQKADANCISEIEGESPEAGNASGHDVVTGLPAISDVEEGVMQVV